MSDHDRLLWCFGSVFPALTPDEIRSASGKSVRAWDSLTAVTLAAVVEQEFSVETNPPELPELSFEAFRNYLDHHRGADPGKDLNKSL